MTEEKGATMVTILDGGSKEGNLGIFETKEMQVAKNRMQEAIANIYYSIHWLFFPLSNYSTKLNNFHYFFYYIYVVVHEWTTNQR